MYQYNVHKHTTLYCGGLRSNIDIINLLCKKLNKLSNLIGGVTSIPLIGILFNLDIEDGGLGFSVESTLGDELLTLLRVHVPVDNNWLPRLICRA